MFFTVCVYMYNSNYCIPIYQFNWSRAQMVLSYASPPSTRINLSFHYIFLIELYFKIRVYITFIKMLPLTGALIVLIICACCGISPTLSASVAGKRGKGKLNNVRINTRPILVLDAPVKCDPCPTGIRCVPPIQCPATVRLTKSEMPQLCDLPAGTHGYCCTSGANHTGKYSLGIFVVRGIFLSHILISCQEKTRRIAIAGRRPSSSFAYVGAQTIEDDYWGGSIDGRKYNE